MAAGTGMQIGGGLAEGRNLEAISEQRAGVDRANAAAAMRRAEEAAKVKLEQGRRMIANQTASIAAGNVRVDVGSPLVLKAQMQKDILKDVGFILEEGDTARRGYLASADIERATGRMYRRRSVWDAITAGLTGITDIAKLGYEAGWWDQQKETTSGQKKTTSGQKKTSSGYAKGYSSTATPGAGRM